MNGTRILCAKLNNEEERRVEENKRLCMIKCQVVLGSGEEKYFTPVSQV